MANCTKDATANYGKCDMMACSFDSECNSWDCESGVCWSWSGRPQQCSKVATDKFYKCAGLTCQNDTECYDLDCENAVCVNDSSPFPNGPCTTDYTQFVNKCPFVQCEDNSECASNDCEEYQTQNGTTYGQCNTNSQS